MPVTSPPNLHRDYKATTPRQRFSFGRGHWRFLAVLSGFLGIVALLGPGHEAEATKHPSTITSAPSVTDLFSNQPDQPASADAAARPLKRTIKVEAGDTLSSIFKRLELEPSLLQQILNSGSDTRELRRLMPGNEMDFETVDGTLVALRYEVSPIKSLHVTRSAAGYTARAETLPVETRNSFASGIIKSSFYSSAMAAGLSEDLILQLADIFGWDIDFALDIRSGDQFSVLYEEEYAGGDKVGNGAVLAAEFVNQGKSYKAVRFSDAKGHSGYYTPDGQAMRKAFLRSPVDFRRISSGFRPARFHPVLGVKRPHRGVDYAAAIGTPIKAAGDGKIIFRGVKGGYGRTVIVQHAGQQSTLYAHMSNFKSGQSVGMRVRQGEVIGYVGQSGLATGPHLHYEFRVNGVHKNPLTIKLAQAVPLAPAYLPEFKRQAGQMLGLLELSRRSTIASR